MGGLTVTVSLRFDENKRIHELMDKYNMKRHEVIKLALRLFLFPNEKLVPLNGREALYKTLTLGQGEAGMHWEARKVILKKGE